MSLRANKFAEREEKKEGGGRDVSVCMSCD